MFSNKIWSYLLWSSVIVVMRPFFVFCVKKSRSIPGCVQASYLIRLAVCLSVCVRAYVLLPYCLSAFFPITECESCTWPISAKPESTEAGELGLSHGTCFVASCLELVAVAPSCWGFGGVFRVRRDLVGAFSMLCNRTHTACYNYEAVMSHLLLCY